MGVIEGLYIFDEHNNRLLEHVYTGRPPAAEKTLASYLEYPKPRPSLIYLPNVSPSTLVFSIEQDRLLFLALSSSEIEPLLVVEFLQRVADALIRFLGSPLLASKLEASYDVVVQIVGEVCDAGLVFTTEPNALEEEIETPSWTNSLLGGLGLPASSPALSRTGQGLQRPQSPFAPGGSSSSPAGSAIPWRKADVRHTSNEVYVDIIENLNVIIAPSGRPLSALVYGNIACKAQISGVPDMTLSLTAPGGKNGINNAMSLPAFHPCVRLARWREKPGELSFIPPDGTFNLAGYECDLLPDLFDGGASNGKIPTPSLNIPVSLELRGGLGPNRDEFEAHISINSKNLPVTSNAQNNLSIFGNRTSARMGTTSPAFSSTPSVGSAPAPAIEGLVVTIPLSTGVRNIPDLRTTKGDAHHLYSEGVVEWRISTQAAKTIGPSGATLRCTLVGLHSGNDAEDGIDGKLAMKSAYDYDEADEAPSSYQAAQDENLARPPVQSRQPSTESQAQTRRAQQNSQLMPRSATLSFSVTGWLASGIRVESLTLNTRTSKGLGAGVTPFKGVKYHLRSDRGIEIRC